MGIFYKVHALKKHSSFCTRTYKCSVEGLELQLIVYFKVQPTGNDASLLLLLLADIGMFEKTV